MIIRTSDYMLPDVWSDADGTVHHDERYDGPRAWVEESEDSRVPLLACSIRWDDMWLTKEEIKRMMDDIVNLPEAVDHGIRWQEMRVVYRDDIDHYVMEIPLYKKSAA